MLLKQSDVANATKEALFVKPNKRGKEKGVGVAAISALRGAGAAAAATAEASHPP